MVTPFCEMKEFTVSALGLEFCFLSFAAPVIVTVVAITVCQRFCFSCLFVRRVYSLPARVGLLRGKLVLAIGSLSNAPDFS